MISRYGSCSNAVCVISITVVLPTLHCEPCRSREENLGVVRKFPMVLKQFEDRIHLHRCPELYVVIYNNVSKALNADLMTSLSKALVSASG